jgi:hypothetical protein
MTTQFSFGRFFAAMMKALKAGVVRAVDGVREWREERRRERQRQNVLRQAHEERLARRGGQTAGTCTRGRGP